MTRRTRLVLTTFALSSLVLTGCADGSDAPTTDELQEIVLRETAPEERSVDLFSAPSHSHRELLDTLREAKEEERVKGVFLRIGPLGSAFGRIGELREALLEVREAKKSIHCHFDTTDNTGYALLAEVCERISMTPSGILALTGLRSQSFYVRDLLDRVGVTADMLQVGRFKGAADMLTRSEMPPELRETMNALLDDLQGEILRGIQAGRELEAAAITSAIDTGPHTAASALRARLIDAITFDDEARAKAKDAAQAKQVTKVLQPDEKERLGLGDLLDLLFGDDKDQVRGERLVLAYVDGTIGDGESESADGVQSGPFVRAMRRFGDDENVRAVVLRIDSPGGSALASDKMWHAVRRVAKRKPVVVSIGDMAASGGYYIACAGDEIFAGTTSLVGSIGVVGGKIVGDKLAENIGVNTTTLTRGQNANWLSPLSPFSETERAALQRALDETYRIFLSRVREGRKLSAEDLDQVAEGRIMSGKRAADGGLVDRTGGLLAAMAHARSKGGLADDAKVEIWPRERSILSRLTSAMPGANDARGSFEALARVPRLRPLLEGSALVRLLLEGDASPLAVLPFAFSFE